MGNKRDKEMILTIVRGACLVATFGCPNSFPAGGGYQAGDEEMSGQAADAQDEDKDEA
jgi:hypothetical protein